MRRILTILCISRRPLTVNELIEAHIVDLCEPQHVDPKRSFSADDIVDICSGLVAISVTKDDDGQIRSTTRIAHFSVQEYLQTNRILQSKAAKLAIQSGSANAEMAQICLVYLLNPILFNGTLDEAKLGALVLFHWPSTPLNTGITIT